MDLQAEAARVLDEAEALLHVHNAAASTTGAADAALAHGLTDNGSPLSKGARQPLSQSAQNSPSSDHGPGPPGAVKCPSHFPM